MKEIEIIHGVYDTISGISITSSRFMVQVNEAEACKLAEPMVAAGRFVVVRPMYNDGNGSYHEWRSFNGHDLMLITFTP